MQKGIVSNGKGFKKEIKVEGSGGRSLKVLV